MKMKKLVALALVTMLAFTTAIAMAGTPKTTELLAGQTIPVGDVSVSDDGTNLTVTYVITNESWVINETHLAVAGSLDAIPQTKRNNPIPGQFEYKNESQDLSITEYTYVIPLDGLSGDVIIAAHAEVVHLNETGFVDQEETAWGNGTSFAGKNWAMYFTYTI
jgi:hypothetical protein